MYTPGQSPMLNNGGVLDGSGTIDPATLNPTAFSSHLASSTHIPPYSPPTSNATEFENDPKPAGSALANSSPRGVKRSRSPAEPYREGPIGDDLGAGPAGEPPQGRTRGRPLKNKGPGVPQSPNLATTPQQQHQQLPPQPVNTPQLQQVPPPVQQPGSLPTRTLKWVTASVAGGQILGLGLLFWLSKDLGRQIKYSMACVVSFGILTTVAKFIEWS